MNITLLSKYFKKDTGIGSYSTLIYEGLMKKEVNLNRISLNESKWQSKNSLAYFYYTAFDLKRILNKKEYKHSDVYHALTPLESLHIPKNKSVATVLDFFGMDGDYRYKTNILSKYFKKAIQSSVKCEKIIVYNKSIKNRLINEFGADQNKIEIIPPSIDGKYHPTNTKTNDIYTIGTISALGKRKRVDLLIKSFLEADIENSNLLIGGRGEDLESLKKIAGGDERIKFLGYVPFESMNNFYNSLDVFVFPTQIEGYGMPIVEAMGCGKPVITLSDADIPIEIKEKTFVVDKDNLANVLENRIYKCDIKRNIEFYKEHSIENRADDLLKVYEKI